MRRLAAGAAALGVVVALAGCSSLPSGFRSPSPTGSPSPSDVPIGTPFGDVAPREQVTDELGTYLHVTLSPESLAATAVDPATVGASIAGSTWDDAALLEAQRFVATFVAEQTIDSIALDRDMAGWEQWLVEVGPQYVDLADTGDLIKPDYNADRPVPIFNDPSNFTPRFVRDGFPRLDDATIEVTSLENLPHEGGEWLEVSGVSDVAYRLSDEEARASLAQQGFDEEVIEGFPELNDGEDGHYLVHLEWHYVVERTQDGYRFRGYDLLWDGIVEGVSQA
ncbi:MAG: hypothetical protein R2717_01795 [Schumannella sp.]|nr:hypothetical protein [Microbacteriaceae bacterium]